MKKRILTIVLALIATSIPVHALVNGRSLTSMLKELSTELREECLMRSEAEQRFNEDYERQHQCMIDAIKKSNELSILLYTQEQDMTFDLAYALKKVTEEYDNFDSNRKLYDQVVNSLNIEIDRYARLIKSLRRFPPVIQEIKAEYMTDSLMSHSDSLALPISDTASSLENEVIRIAARDTLPAPFVLEEDGEAYRDSCIIYASELLKMNINNLSVALADSTHYQEAYQRIKEAHTYAKTRYHELEKYVFIEGQTPFTEILAHRNQYWSKTKADLRKQYSLDELNRALQNSNTQDSTALDTNEDDDDLLFSSLNSKAENTMLIIVSIIQLASLALTWLLAYIVIRVLSRFERFRRFVTEKRRSAIAILAGTTLYFLVFAFFWGGDEYIKLSVEHINTFLWLLMVIFGSLLLRVKTEQIKHSVNLYTPTIFIALTIIICRINFIPDRLMVLLFPPILLLTTLRQLYFCIKKSGIATSIDSMLGWISLAIYFISFVFSFAGYTFAALLILVGWYFLLAAWLTFVCISDLLDRYKARWLDKKVAAMRRRITYVTGEDRESLLFGATWFYDFIRQVVMPALLLSSLPLCLRLALDIFDFDDLYVKIYQNPFVHLFDKNGFDTLRISGQSIVHLLILFCILRYVSRAVRALWRYFRYTSFMRKHKRTTIRVNEINLSLGNSIITALIWMSYAVVVITVWRIPTGSMGLVAGGLSAGIGLALKDTINNFIYGIQLMGGKLRVGDWIECDGVRGKVTSVNYQCVQIETIEGTEISLLNSSLFGKNFNNLTHSNSYELTTITVGLAHGTEVNKVRKVLVEAMQKMRTKDHYGREIVDPKYGIYVVVNDMGDSAVEIAVKQYVLVAEKVAYVDGSKEVIYDALQEAGIPIAFPQRDLHIVGEMTQPPKPDAFEKNENTLHSTPVPPIN